MSCEFEHFCPALPPACRPIYFMGCGTNFDAKLSIEFLLTLACCFNFFHRMRRPFISYQTLNWWIDLQVYGQLAPHQFLMGRYIWKGTILHLVLSCLLTLKKIIFLLAILPWVISLIPKFNSIINEWSLLESHTA